MAVTFIPVKTPEGIEKLAELATGIWNEYWPDRIGQAQTDYMVEQFQSIEAITRDIADNAYEYWFVQVEPEEGEGDAHIVGYTGGHAEPETNRFFISKIYMLKNERGHGCGTAVIEHYEQLCRDRGFRAMYLTVNKYNTPTIGMYESRGFETIDSVVNDIGNGFVMDDYVMERSVEESAEV